MKPRSTKRRRRWMAYASLVVFSSVFFIAIYFVAETFKKADRAAIKSCMYSLHDNLISRLEKTPIREVKKLDLDAAVKEAIASNRLDCSSVKDLLTSDVENKFRWYLKESDGKMFLYLVFAGEDGLFNKNEDIVIYGEIAINGGTPMGSNVEFKHP